MVTNRLLTGMILQVGNHQVLFVCQETVEELPSKVTSAGDKSFVTEDDPCPESPLNELGSCKCSLCKAVFSFRTGQFVFFWGGEGASKWKKH